METTTIRIDRETKTRLEELANNTPLMRYLRNLSINLAGKPFPASPIEKRLDAVEEKLSKILIVIEEKIKAGDMVRESSEHLDLLGKHLENAPRGESYIDAAIRENKEDQSSK